MRLGRIFQRLLAVLLAISITIAGTAGSHAGAAFGPYLNTFAGPEQVVTVRFISPDTMDPTMPGVGTNRYSYSQNDPINKSDPNGHAWGLIGAIGTFLGALLGGTKEANTPKNDNDVSNTSDSEAIVNMAIGAASGSMLALIAKGIVQGKKKTEIQSEILEPSTPNSAGPEWTDNITADTREIVPDDWGPAISTKKGEGLRWIDPNKKGNGIRIDRGNPNSTNPSQQVDHVVINSEGKIIGRDGLPIRGSIKNDPVNAHVPYKDWLGWNQWNKPR